ncbi:MAG TPA: preprotein translocase subunit SecA, partial [Candidatus Margulisiibacteriota bacterium]|nr:preprotein translocase subunit SecA [Candidatus Margulisiibacteriota bacterium]
MLNIVKKIVGTKNDRELKRMRPLVEQVSQFEPAIAALSNEELRAKTEEFRSRIREKTATERHHLEERLAEQRRQADAPTIEDATEGAKDLKTQIDEADKELRAAENRMLDEILPEAFACVREASKRTTGLRHFDVQFIGGIVLHEGKISEMKTGEGKTLVATGPLYLNALTGRGAHLVTVNDYLARRDVQWMGPIFHLLGVSVASIVHDYSYLFDPTYVVKDYRMLNLRPIERKEAYRADITYGTNHEFGFDYLRDNMKFTLEEYVQRELNFAIVDEVDNILIDEARTPLIISGPAEESTDKYYIIDRVIPRLKKGVRKERQGDAPAEESGDYWVDEKSRSAVLTEGGVAKVERMLGVTNLYDPNHIDTLHHVNQALKAHALFQRDVDYIVKDGQVIIVDEFTGRLMPGRRWSDGLHQAVEAKEGVRIERENQTLATITIQNYFRMYKKLAGMTGTADTESVEFKNIYKLDVVVVPPNKKMIRIDHPDVVYKSEREKFDAVIEEVEECHERGQPVLVGTVSVEKSERLAKMLKKKGIKHNVLNAVNHEAEANVIAQAGRHKAVTIATNMAGRGTDILLGGNPEFLARSDMENEWIQRSSALPEGGQRYEEVLQKLRDKYDDTIQQARKQYEPKWQPFEEKQAEALERLTEAHRTYLEAEFWAARADYEDKIARLAVQPEPALASACADAAASYSEALQGVDRVTGPYFGDEGQQRFLHALDELQQALREAAHNGGGNANRLSAAQTVFERARNDYERAIQKALAASHGDANDLEAARRVYTETEREYKQAEAAYLEQRKPFEEAVAAAQRDYEETRRKYTKAVEDVREEMEKAPLEFRGRYEQVLHKYQELCAQEREKVIEAGGLYIVGTERHESRRIDNQLRGRSGRQGDPGASRFFLSLEDDLLRIFGAERIQGLMTRLGMEEGEPIEHRLITRAVANAQSKVEGHNFDIRKHLLEYDDVMNQQREIVYGRRREILGSLNLKADVLLMADDVAAGVVEQFANRELHPDEWDWQALSDSLFKSFSLRFRLSEEQNQAISPERLEQAVIDAVRAAYEEKERTFSPPVLRHLEKLVLLETLDSLWKDHLLSMDHLKEGIGLRGYAQQNPLQEYKKEGFELFEEMMQQLETDVVEKVFTVQIARQEDVQRMEARRRPQPMQMVMAGGG